MAFLYKADPVRGAEWARLFATNAPDIPFHVWPDTGKTDHVRYLAAWVPPHIASMTQPETAVEQVLANIRRHQAGAPLIGLVDRSRGY